MRGCFVAVLGIFATALAAGAAHSATPQEVASTVILANTAVPASVEVARYYAKKRGIPEENICYLKTSAEEIITRKEYESQIAGPVAAFLHRWGGGVTVKLPEGVLGLELGKRRPRYLVATYGIPVKVAGYEDVKTMYLSSAAAVDSELAVLPHRGKYQLAGPGRNRYFGADAPFGPPWSQSMYLVARLDGPNAEVAKRLVDDAIWAEENGLKGKAYFDARGLKPTVKMPGTNKRPGGYLTADIWIRNAYEACKRAGIPSVLDNKPEVMPMNYPMTDAAIYLGWYTPHFTGPMTKKDFRFNRGAIAYHLHSFSALVVRVPHYRWVGPLLQKGACVTMGAVYEPFLIGTPHLDIFMDRMLKGYNFAEAGYMSLKYVSWQIVLIGDPLYRPFAGNRR